jgi:hypothetical protein
VYTDTGASPYLLPGWRWLNLALLTVLGSIISVRYLRHEIGSIGRQVALFAILFSLNVLFMVPTIGL